MFCRLASAEKPFDIEVQEDLEKCEFPLEKEPSVEDQNNTEAISSTPSTLELNEISVADQKAFGSVQLNVVEAKCEHQKTLESVLKVSPAQKLFERKLSKTWKQECTTYNDLNRNVPSLSPYGDQSHNFASSSFVKSILDHTRKRLHMALDVSSIANCENPKPNTNIDSLEIQERENEDCSSPEDAVVALNDCCKSQAISKRQQKGNILLRTRYTCTLAYIFP